MSNILDAVTAVFVFENELFIIKRQASLKAFPGYWAFPGGKVDLNDEQFAFDHPSLNHISTKLLGALAREIQEELGFDIRESLSRGIVKSIDLLGVAVTPDFNPYRFATSFFKIEISKKINFTIDHHEAEVGEWKNAKELLRDYKEGSILAVPPVIKVIECLGQNSEQKSISDLNLTYDPNDFVPMIESMKGIRQFMPLSHTLPPATRTNCFLIGDQLKILVDPSPKDHEELRKLKNSIDSFGVDKILLTHHHPDHHQFADDLAREYKVPLLLSSDTEIRISRKYPGFFNDVTTSILKDGDVITTWLGHQVLIMEIPGHDEGQIALYSSDLSWFIAGDLFQGVGTVVVGGDEGDMSKYFSTLEKIIALNPKVLFPSHGIGVGSTYVLVKTLEHRRMRENQIFTLHQQGLSPLEMLPLLYSDVKKELWPYALENIEKHLLKLKSELRIG